MEHNLEATILLKAFVKARPAVKLSAIAEYIGADNSSVTMVLSGKYRLNSRYYEKLKEFAKLYGYKDHTSV